MAGGATDDSIINPEEAAGSTRYQSGPLLDSADTEDSIQGAQGARGVVPSGGLEGVMLLMKQLIESMPANIAAAVKVDKPYGHLDNAKLDVRNFQRINTFSNKHGDWKEWKSQFAYAVVSGIVQPVTVGYNGHIQYDGAQCRRQWMRRLAVTQQVFRPTNRPASYPFDYGRYQL